MKSNPNLVIGQKVKFDRKPALPDKPDTGVWHYGTIVGVEVHEDDGVSYLIREDYKRVRNTIDVEKLKLVRGPFTRHESNVQPDNVYVGKRVIANWPEKKYSRTVRVYWWYNNHVLVGPEDIYTDIYTDDPQNYQIVDRSQIEDVSLVSLPLEQFLHAAILYAFELMCEYGLVKTEKLTEVVEVVKACGTRGARRALKQYAANKGYGMKETLAEAVRTEQWGSSGKCGEPVAEVWTCESHTTEVPNTSAENVTKHQSVPLVGVCNMLNVPAGMSGLTTLEFRSYKGRVCEETIHLCHKPDPAPIKEGDAVTVTPEGEIHKLVTAGAGRDGMTKLRIKEIARIIGAHPDALEACDRVTVVSGGVVKTMPSEEFIRDFDKFFDIQFARPAKGDTTPAETTVNCGGPLVSASVVKEKDALIARLKAMIKEKDGRLRDQGEKIKGLHRDLKIVKKYINISPSSVVTTIGEVITTHNKLMKLQTEVERLEHAGRNNLASIDAAMRREACAVAEADQAKKELEAQKNYVAHLKNQISVLEGVVNRLSKESK